QPGQQPHRHPHSPRRRHHPPARPQGRPRPARPLHRRLHPHPTRRLPAPPHRLHRRPRARPHLHPPRRRHPQRTALPVNEAIRIATRAPRRLLMSLALLVSGAALAHAHLEASTPAANATITQPLTTVTPTFSEPIETLFSVVKAYRLDADVDMSAANAWQRLNGLAGALVH